jgi:hypothetical protein
MSIQPTTVPHDKIAGARILTLRAALRLETQGLGRRGRSVYSIVKEEFGFKGNKQAVLDQLNAHIEANILPPTYRFIEDPGHGWLEVPVTELQALGIADKISGYSYVSRDGRTAYLEEDCDATKFIAAKCDNVRGTTLASWFSENARREHQDPTFVRDLPSYAADRVQS